LKMNIFLIKDERQITKFSNDQITTLSLNGNKPWKLCSLKMFP